MNFLAGRRAVMGNYNEPRNFAAYLNDFPAQNRVTIRDANGAPIANADVFLYQAQKTVPTERWYGARFDDTPDLTLKTDANGQVLVGRSPFSPDGKVTHAPDLNDGVVIVKVKKDNFVAHGFLESRLFNLEYWRGNTQLADHELIVGRECTADGPHAHRPRVECADHRRDDAGMGGHGRRHRLPRVHLDEPRQTMADHHARDVGDTPPERPGRLVGGSRPRHLRHATLGLRRFQGTATPVPRRRAVRR